MLTRAFCVVLLFALSACLLDDGYVSHQDVEGDHSLSLPHQGRQPRVLSNGSEIAVSDHVDLAEAAAGSRFHTLNASRRLQQTEGEEEGSQDFECTLGSSQTVQILDEDTRTWRITDAALDELGNELQTVVSCTQEGDVVLFDVSETVRLASRVTIPWRLTLSADIDSTDLVDGVFPRTRTKASFRCPTNNQGVFLIQARGVLLANLEFRNCSLDSLDEHYGIVEVQSCQGGRIRETVQLHHVSFRRNRLVGSVALLVNAPSCSAVEMVDVRFRQNQCSDDCGATLSIENRLQEVVIEENALTGEVFGIPAFLHAAAGSETIAQGISASDNQGTILLVERGTLTLSNSTFSRNLADISERQQDFSACIHLVESDATIEASAFQDNKADFGSAIFSEASNMSVTGCVFEGNNAGQGGAVELQDFSSASFDSSNFSSNHAVDGGGVIYAVHSNVSMVNAILFNNSAEEHGGCMCVAYGSNLTVRRSSFSQNMARDGGAIAVNTFSTARMTNCVFDNSTSLARGGAVYSEESNLTINACNLKTGSSMRRGGLISTIESKLEIRSSRFESGHARTNGGCLSIEDTVADLRNVSTTLCESEIQGGAIFSSDSVLTLRQSILHSNRAGGWGGGMYTYGSTSIWNVSIENNTAVDGAGGIAVVNGGKLEISDTAFIANSVTHPASPAGAIYCGFNATANVSNCIFDSNAAGSRGGAVDVIGGVLSFSRIQFRGNAADAGGAIFADVDSRAFVRDAICVNGSALEAGCFYAFGGSLFQIQNVTMQSNTAINRGGAVAAREAAVHIFDSRIESNTAGDTGGAVDGLRSALRFVNTAFDNNKAVSKGGATRIVMSGSLNVVNSSFVANSAESGAAVSLDGMITGTIVNATFTRNNASMAGGAMLLKNVAIELEDCQIIENSARFGGGFSIRHTSLSLINSDFIDCSAIQVGGSMHAVQNSTITALTVTVSDSTAENGGAVGLDGSSLEAEDLSITSCRASSHGGGIFGNGTSTLLCTDCVLESNIAGGRGGAVSIESNQTQLLAVQFVNGVMQDNSAEYGGALHFVSSDRTVNCTEPRAKCTFVVLSGTTLRRNSASCVGGAIFANDISAIRVNCSRQRSTQAGFYRRKEWSSMNAIRSSDDVCPEWRGNSADEYGQAVGTYAAKVKKVIYQQDRDAVVLYDGYYFVANHASGSALPTVYLEVVDWLGQGPAIGVLSDNISATMSSPEDFFDGSVTVLLEDGHGNISGVTGFQPPGHYNVVVSFSEESLKPLVIEVQIRGCRIGEAAAASGSICEPCNGETYNFFPEDGMNCQPCHKDGNCVETFIRPNKGHWHQSPCSDHIQRCLTNKECDFEGRDEKLAEMMKSYENCNFDERFITSYNEAQCAVGHKGPLCGSCKEAYGRSRAFTCSECLHDSGNVFLIILSGLLLLALAGFTVRSNLITVLTFPCQAPATSSLEGPSSRRISITMMEMWCSGQAPAKVMHPTYQENASMQRAKESELAKWKAVELFKITVNFLQITAIAISVNVDWSKTLINMFEAAEFVGGVTSEAAYQSIDCLVSDGGAVPRSIVSTVIDALLPIGVICVFALLWTIVTIRHAEDVVYFLKRFTLSAIAVFYISYISITQTLVNCLNCIEVHDSVDVLVDTTTDYWALDTGLKCYEGAHAVLAGALGWPFLALFTIGFPVALAFVIVKNVKEDYKRGWVYDVAGFAYRSYRPKFVFWESMIMLRKAVLAVLVDFAYPLRGNLQGLLAVLVLVLALYSQMICRPFRDEFDDLNQMEGLSLLVSLLTFVSSLFFEDERVDTGPLILITVAVCLCNIGLFIYFSLLFFFFGSKYLRTVLEREGVTHDKNGGACHILRVYLFRYLCGTVLSGINSAVRRFHRKQRRQ